MGYEACINCKKRHPACQDSCLEYINAKDTAELYKEKIKKAKSKDKMNREYINSYYDKRRK